MEIINITGIDEKIYFEKMINGLEVYLFPMLKRNEAAAMFVTRYGGKDIEFVPYNGNEMIKIREGVAHFLEHRLCTNSEGQDLFDFYAKTGSSFNAYTSHHLTTYHFNCTIDLINNLVHLIDNVQNAIFKEKDIEKEKGIIEQEIKMRNDNPDVVLYEENMKNLFSVNPFRHNLIGTVDDVMSVDKEVLSTCYNTFYHPSNMYLIVTGNFDVNEVMNAIRENQSSKKFEQNNKIILKDFDEPNKVNKDYCELYYPIEVPKLKFNVKIPLTDLKKIANYDYYISVIFRTILGSTSLFMEYMKEKGYLAYNLSLSFDEIGNHYIVTIDAEGNYLDEVVKEIKKALSNIEISEEELERLKKYYISNEITSYENVSSVREYINYMIIEYGKILNDEVGRIKSLNINDLKEVIKLIDLTNIAVTILKPKKD